METNHGPPRNKAFLAFGQYIAIFQQLKNTAYNNIPAQIRLCTNLHGKTGSMCLAATVTLLSHTRKHTHKIPDTVNSVITNPDLHGKSLPASVNAATRSRVAPRSRKVPRKSTRRIAVFGNASRTLRDSRSRRPWNGKPVGK